MRELQSLDGACCSESRKMLGASGAAVDERVGKLDPVLSYEKAQYAGAELLFCKCCTPKSVSRRASGRGRSGPWHGK
jgi:hypothetical protein